MEPANRGKALKPHSLNTSRTQLLKGPAANPQHLGCGHKSLHPEPIEFMLISSRHGPWFNGQAMHGLGANPQGLTSLQQAAPLLGRHGRRLSGIEQPGHQSGGLLPPLAAPITMTSHDCFRNQAG